MPERTLSPQVPQADGTLDEARQDLADAPLHDPVPRREPYFEIYRADRVTLTSILFSGEDWRWRFCAASGESIAVSVGYASEKACKAAIAALRSGAGSAGLRTGKVR